MISSPLTGRGSLSFWMNAKQNILELSIQERKAAYGGKNAELHEMSVSVGEHAVNIVVASPAEIGELSRSSHLQLTRHDVSLCKVSATTGLFTTRASSLFDQYTQVLKDTFFNILFSLIDRAMICSTNLFYPKMRLKRYMKVTRKDPPAGDTEPMWTC
jgi:hypothetical protein